MPFSYHSHSGEFCKHGSDSLESIIKRSVEIGYTQLGLSEHVPRFKLNDRYPEEEGLETYFLTKQFASYYKEAKKLQIKYKNGLEILVGAETEYLDDTYLKDLSSYFESLKDFEGIDYLVGSVHHLSGYPIDFDLNNYSLALEANGSDLQQLFENYFDTQYKMLQHFQPEIIGHFDLIVLFTDKNLVESLNWSNLKTKIIRNLIYINSYGGLIEINSRGIKKFNQPYPTRKILKILINNGAKFTLSDDAHAVKDVAKHYGKVKEYLVENDIKDLFYLRWYDVEDKNQHVRGVKRSGKTEVKKAADGWLNLPFWNQFEN